MAKQNFSGLTPAKPGHHGSVCCGTGSLSGKGVRMNDLQGKGGLQANSLGQISTSGGAAGAKMDNRGGKGIAAKGVGQINTGSGTGQKMNTQGKGN